MENIEDIISRCKRKKVSSKKRINNMIITKILLSTIFLFASLIYIKSDEQNKLLYQDKIFTDSLSFTKINKFYEKHFGNVMPVLKKEEVVFSNKITFSKIENYLEGEVLTIQEKSPISNINGGMVVFVGEKEGYGNTVIIQGNDSYDIWYGNLTNISVKLYDYLEKETILGETKNNKLYLVIKKDNNFIKYEKYKN